jgi:hypothetical protein
MGGTSESVELKAPDKDLPKVIKNGADTILKELDQLIAHLEELDDVYVDTVDVRDILAKMFDMRRAAESKLYKLSTVINRL